MNDWRPFAARLADQLHATGDLRTTAWHKAIAEVPRHVLVPTAYQTQQSHGAISHRRLNTAENLGLVYSTSTLVTTVVPNKYGSLVPVSSSTKPDLMVRMLETLDIRDGQRILEIGTGTGYNAALLAHRLGDDNVFSIDIDPELVNTARQRLAHIGHHPHLAVHDGADGWPQHAPYHRIIATCGVRQIPWTWYDQLTPDGQLLVDFKPHGGNLVLLEKKADRLEGRFTARYAAFMVMRQHDDHDKPSPPWQPEISPGRHRLTVTPVEPPSIVGFLRSVISTTPLRRGYIFDNQTRQPTAIKLTAADGSCCEVDLFPDRNGTRAVREGGPTPLWAEIERVYQQWHDWGEPGWDRVGLTVRPQTWTVWLDEPHNIISRAQPISNPEARWDSTARI
jgi:protein-L-isoaspartate(D-aspartate) O-methyltransferase